MLIFNSDNIIYIHFTIVGDYNIYYVITYIVGYMIYKIYNNVAMTYFKVIRPNIKDVEMSEEKFTLQF